MAYAPSRSMNAELNEGSTDGKYKKVINDRGGSVDPATYRSRIDLYDRHYGIHEEQVKLRGDGKPVHTPNFIPTAAAELL